MRFAVAAMALLFGCLCQAKPLVEQYAEKAAQGANNQFAKAVMTDGVTVAARAYAQGPAIVYEYTLAIKASANESELKAWRSSNRAEIIPPLCAALKSDDFFMNRGLQLQYLYINTKGQLLDDFKVNKPSCAAYGF